MTEGTVCLKQTEKNSQMILD